MDILEGGAGADDFYIGENDIVVDLDPEDRVFLNGVQIAGGIEFGMLDQDPGSGNPVVGQYAIGLQGEAYMDTYVPDVGVPNSGISGSLTIVLPGAQGTAYLFGIEASEYTFDWTLPITYPGGISIQENHPDEYYSSDKGWWAPEYAISAYWDLMANGYTWEGMQYGEQANDFPIWNATEAAYGLLLESGFTYNGDGTWTADGGSGGSGQIQFSSINHAPTSIAISAYTVDENTAGAVIGALSVSDLDGEVGHTFSVSDTRFEVINGQLKLKAGQSLDYEAEQAVTVKVTATDQGGLYVEQAFWLTVLDKIEDTYGTSGDDALSASLGMDVLHGLEGNDTLDGGLGADTLIGGTGDDLYVVDNAGDVIVEDLDEGADTIQTSLAWTLAENTENLILTGNRFIQGTGNELSNVIQGNTGANQLAGLAGDDMLLGGNGADTLDGGEGKDILYGGAGNDRYLVDHIADQVVENANEGTDIVESSVDHTLSENVETLVLTGISNINGTGNALANTISGNTGGNVLDGAAGNDILDGGEGNDTYRFGYGYDQDQVKDLVGGATPIDVLELGGGVDVGDVNVSKSGTSLVIRLAGSNDRVEIVDYFAGGGNGIETIRFADTTEWSRSFIDGLFLTGSTGNDVLAGDANNNWISGNGGTDKMAGGAGSDTYVVDSSGDTVTENPDEGYDVVESTITYALGANVEALTLVSGSISGTGNILDNRILGSTGNNTLNGGAGNDLLIGGAGSDTYVVDSIGDQLIELVNQGTDTVQSSVDWILGENFENLTLTGSTSINGIGNVLNNSIAGNAGTNNLSGGAGNDTLNGGTGADTLIGGAGNDIYVVDNVGDVTTEEPDEGTDTVQSAVTWALAANVENLTLTGSSAISGTGTEFDNVLTGNSGANQLSGGAGNDTLSGGAGADTLTGGTAMTSMWSITSAIVSWRAPTREQTS